jgi:hypothetical protein
MKRRMRSWLAIAALFTALAGSLSGADDLTFRWAFGAMTGVGQSRHFVRITDDVRLRSGDELQMFLSPVTACFIYVLHEDPTGAFTVLFPPAPGGFPGNYGAAREYYVPASDWLMLDRHKGMERIYLIASRDRLSRFEALVLRRKAATQKDVVGELAALLKQRAANWSERPVTMAGQIRGTPGKPNYPDVAAHAAEITVPGFFTRVFVIDHR